MKEGFICITISQVIIAFAINDRALLYFPAASLIAISLLYIIGYKDER